MKPDPVAALECGQVAGAGLDVSRLGAAQANQTREPPNVIATRICGLHGRGAEIVGIRIAEPSA